MRATKIPELLGRSAVTLGGSTAIFCYIIIWQFTMYYLFRSATIHSGINPASSIPFTTITSGIIAIYIPHKREFVSTSVNRILYSVALAGSCVVLLLSALLVVTSLLSNEVDIHTATMILSSISAFIVFLISQRVKSRRHSEV
jgi:ABC-type cobalamin transport system permease subunit